MDFGSIFHRFVDDFCVIFRDFRTVLGPCSDKFWADVGTMLCHVWENNDNICEGL